MPRKPANGRDHAIGNAIRLYRWQRGMRMKDVAKRLGITHQQAQKYETGQNRISAAMLADIAAILEMPIAAFFREETEAAPVALGALELGHIYDTLQLQERKHLLGIARALAGKHGVNENA